MTSTLTNGASQRGVRLGQPIPNDACGMNKERLSDWVKSEVAKKISLAAIGRALGVSGQTVSDWRDQKYDKMQPRQVESLAHYRGETVAETCHWLEIPVPEEATLSRRVKQLELKVLDLTQTLELVLEHMSGLTLTPSPLAIHIQDALIQRFYDLRDISQQQRFLDDATAALQGNRLAAHKVMLQILGATSITTDDYPDIAHVLEVTLGPHWSVGHLLDIADKTPKG